MRVPKYYRVKEQIGALLDGSAPGTALPTERELAEQFATSRTTVRQALAELGVEGRLVRTQGRGTFVADPGLVRLHQLSSFTADLATDGQRGTDTVLGLAVVPAEEPVAARLAVAPGDPVVRLERVRGIDDRPVAHETAWLRGPLPGLDRHLTATGSLYRTLADRYGITVAAAEDQIETAPAVPEDAALLGVDVGVPMLLVHRTAWDAAGRPVEWTRSVYRGDRFRFLARSALTDPPAAPV